MQLNNESLEHLIKNEERYSLAVSGAGEGLWDWNLEEDSIYYSERWKGMLGYEESELTDSLSEWFDRIHKDDIRNVRKALDMHLNGQTSSFEIQYRILHKDGSYIWVSSRGKAVKDSSNKPVRIAGFQSDVSTQKDAEEELKKALNDLRFALASEKVLLDELDKRNKELVELSVTDGLTGLYNHRFLQERFSFEFKRARRYATNLSCLMIDIDHFKKVNDTYGHQFGDLVLREISVLLKENSREVDICGRYGGEEFLILSNQKAEGAYQFASKLHSAVEKHTFREENDQANITVSIGLAEYQKGIQSKQELLERADVALYKAKEDGRNLIRIWKEEKKEEVYRLDSAGIKELKHKFMNLSNRMRAVYIESADALLKAVDARDNYTREHSQNVSNYSVAIAQKLNMNDEDIEVIKYSGMLHDVGKIGISQDILLKKEKLTQGEVEMLHQHPEIAVNILKDVDFLEKELPIILHHHERFDGKGYPQGLKGKEIPLGARILCVADTFDAVTTDREFQKRMKLNDAVALLSEGKGTQFDPGIVDVFIEYLQKETKDNLDGYILKED